MVNINTSQMHSLSQLTSHLATQNQADDKEVRAHNGKDIFVKEGAPKNKSISARISHQNKAKDIVVNLLTKQGIPKDVAKLMLKNVLNGENKLTLGSLKNLERLSSGPSSHWPAPQAAASSSKTNKTS
ncbi:hypothetical protein HKB25_04400, partial [Vibrio parahaemolyticus]|nr:hypothetical protein [Vibrio parahaemolyticus]